MYMTLDEMKSFASELGANIIKVEEYLEPGYKQHLIDEEEICLMDEGGNDEISLPNSNMIVVIEKSMKS